MPPTADEDAEEWMYELIPMSQLPHVDLRVSLRSHFVHNKALQQLLRALGASSAVLIGYLVHVALGLSLFFIPAHIGRITVIAEMFIGLPGALVALGNLRYDFIRLQIRTYDVWFFSCVSAIVSVLTSALFRDERSLLMIFSWVSFQATVFVDAGSVGLRSTLLASFFSAISYFAMAIAICFEITDELHPFDIIRVNSHGLPAIPVVRDNIATMVVVLVRNVFRRFHHVKTCSPNGHGMIECVSFRCNLQVRPLQIGPSHPTNGGASTVKLDATSPPAEIIKSANQTQLVFVPFLDPIDARQTLLPLQWLFATNTPVHSAWHPSRLVYVGIAGFVVSNLAFFAGLLSPSLHSRPDFCALTSLATTCSVIFVTISIGMAHRKVFWAVVTSFNFAFIGLQAMIVHFTFLDLCHWQPVLVIAFGSDFVWNFWMICWDALLPPVRRRLGLMPRFAAWIGLGLLLFRVACGVAMFVLLEPSKINDRAVFTIKFGRAVFELRPIAWYVSCNMTIFSWAVRIMWRLWFAQDDELVVLDGPVAYEKPRASIQRPNQTTAIARAVHVAPILVAS